VSGSVGGMLDVYFPAEMSGGGRNGGHVGWLKSHG